MMISKTYQPTSGQCFTFWYHLYGSTIGNVTLFQRVNGIDSPLWTRNQDEGNVWHPALVTLKSTAQFQVCNKKNKQWYCVNCEQGIFERIVTYIT